MVDNQKQDMPGVALVGVAFVVVAFVVVVLVGLCIVVVLVSQQPLLVVLL